LRSLFISKFLFKNNYAVINLFGSILKIRFKKEKAYVGLVSLFFFFVTSLYPQVILNFGVIRGKKKLKLNYCKATLNIKYMFIFLEKLNILYFPNLEN
jgi:hypothetical protein